MFGFRQRGRYAEPVAELSNRLVVEAAERDRSCTSGQLGDRVTPWMRQVRQLVGAISRDHQEAEMPRVALHEIEQLQRRGVRPLQVVDEECHRRINGEIGEQLEHCVEHVEFGGADRKLLVGFEQATERLLTPAARPAPHRGPDR